MKSLCFFSTIFSISNFPYFNALGTNFETTFIKFVQNIVLKWLQRRQLASFWLFWGRSGVPFWLLWGVLGLFGPHFMMPWRISAHFFRDLGLPRLSKHPSSPIPDALQFSNLPSFQMGEAECAERLNLTSRGNGKRSLASDVTMLLSAAIYAICCYGGQQRAAEREQERAAESSKESSSRQQQIAANRRKQQHIVANRSK